MYQEKYLSSPWIKGLPKEDGFYLLRFNWLGNMWIAFFQALDGKVIDRPGRMLFLDHRSGAFHSKFSQLGKPTHHCLATPENVAEILNNFVKMRFDKEKTRWVEK